MKDVGGPISKKVTSTATKSENSTSAVSVKASQSKTGPTEKENKVENKVTVTKIFEFAGEEVK